MCCGMSEKTNCVSEHPHTPSTKLNLSTSRTSTARGLRARWSMRAVASRKRRGIATMPKLFERGILDESGRRGKYQSELACRR